MMALCLSWKVCYLGAFATSPPSHDISGNTPQPDHHWHWLPSTLRWTFLLTLIVLSMGLCVAVSTLCWLSHRGQGLGADGGGDAILIGWRFSPTLICVVYAQLISMLFEDIMRTEPFASMSRPRGAPAAASILERSKPWWSGFIDPFRNRKEHGKGSILFLVGSTIFFLSVLVISPLSSSFLISYNVAVQHDVPFHRAALGSTPLSLNATPETFLSTTGHLFYNLSGTPWISGPYVVLPFWPASSPNESFQNTVSASAREWTVETKVMRVEYPCKQMEIRSHYKNRTFTAQGHPYAERGLTDETFTLNGTAKMLATSLSLPDDCQFEVDIFPSLRINMYDSVVWARFSDSFYEASLTNSNAADTINNMSSWDEAISWLYVPGNTTYNLELNSGNTSPFLRFKGSDTCSDKQIILLATPLLDNERLLSNYSQKAWACSSNISLAEVPVTISMSSASSNISFDEGEFLRKCTIMPPSMLNISEVHHLLHTRQWSSYSVPASLFSHEAAIPLTQFYSEDFSALSRDQGFPSKAGTVFARFFGEVFQSSLLRIKESSQEAIQGQAISFEKRVVVVQGVGITLAVLFATNAILATIIFKQSRPRVRPLNLHSDPSSILTVASIFARGHVDTRLWQELYITTKSSMGSLLASRVYEMSSKNLQEVNRVTCE
jgi:hypothetical protein